MKFDLECNLELFRLEQPGLFDNEGKRRSDVLLSDWHAELMLDLINDLKTELLKLEKQYKSLKPIL